jgi:uncharacterized protein YtpQ (UPF0354 family)
MTCHITLLQLQTEVLAYLKKAYPGRPFTQGESLDVVLMGNVEFGLQNLWSKLCLAEPPLTAAAREDAIQRHLEAMMLLVDRRETALPREWAGARALVTLQFITTHYLSTYVREHVLVTRPFVAGVELGVVLIQSDGYGFVREEDRARWGVPEHELFETALKNLDQRSAEARLQGRGDPDRFLSLEEKDGYDAVRLLVPWIRQEASKFLGDPFLAAIPNRDFLIMWSTKNSPEFQTFGRTRAQEDFETQPYPLTRDLLRVWADGRTELA